MFKISYDKKITMVQGDTGVIRMRIHNYELSQGDEVRFAIVNKANPSILLCQHSDNKIVLEKQVTVFEKDGSARIVIYPYDTEYLQPGKYLYEIQVKTKDGRIDTVVSLTSFTLMDGAIEGEFGQTTPSKPEPTPSEIELRFKRLENEIIPELGNRITNVENEIDSVSSSLEHIACVFDENNDNIYKTVKADNFNLTNSYIPKDGEFIEGATGTINGAIVGRNNNITLSKVKINRTSTEYGQGVYIETADNFSLKDSTVESEYSALAIGGTGNTKNPKKSTILNNRFNSKKGNHTRTATSVGSEDSELNFVLNRVLVQTNDVGFESWTKDTMIALNRIENPNNTGGWSGITIGHEGEQRVFGNIIKGFGCGIEVGAVGYGCIISDNIIKRCGVGINISPNTDIHDINIVNNFIELTTNGKGVSFSKPVCKSASINGLTVKGSDNFNYNDTQSRNGIGIDGTASEIVYIENSKFINLKYVVKSYAETKKIIFRNCVFSNITRVNSGGCIEIEYDNCLFENFEYPPSIYSAVGGMVNKFNDCMFYQHDDFVKRGRCAFEGENGKGVIYNIDNKFINCLGTCQVSNSSNTSSDGSGNYNPRCEIEIQKNKIRLSNLNTFADILNVFSNCNFEIPQNMYIETYYTGWQLKKVSENNFEFYNISSLPTWAGNSRGDKAYNKSVTGGAYLGWVYLSGETWKGFGLIEN